MPELYRPKEISWLSFNERVLKQAFKKNIPLYERIKFLGIYSNNMDEFYRVRVATLKRLTKLKEKAIEIIGYNPLETIKCINKIVIEQNKLYEKARLEIRAELRRNKVHVVDENNLTSEQRDYAKNFFCKELKNSLMPIILRDKKQVLDLVDDNIYFALNIYLKGKKKNINAIMQLPTHKFDRFFILPKIKDNVYIMYLDDVVRLGLKNLFYFLDVEKIDAYAFKITKDSELDIEDDISASYLELIDQSLKRRKKGNPVRLLYDKNISPELLENIKKLFKIGGMDTILSGGRYHNTKDLLAFPNVLSPEYSFDKMENISIGKLETQKSFFTTLKKQDIFLHYPYHTFNYFIDFLKEAALDTKVKSIKVTLYRLAKKSDVIAALVNAANNGKDVTAVIELQARFDESENIYWSKVLSEAGVKVIYGVPGLKVHSKLTLISRIENEKIVNYSAIGTGNYNESTAKVYTDITILSSNPKITNEVSKLFLFLKNNYKHFKFSYLLVSPFNFRLGIKKLIHKEIENAKHGKKAYIHIKINNIDDREIINLLYEASQKGVEVILLVRGMFSLVTEIPGKSDKIIARAVIDRYLEHARFMIFANDNDPKVFIASADLMIRNIDRRIEVTMPVYDTKIKKIIIDLFDIHSKDNMSSFILDQKLSNKPFTQGKNEVRAQYEVYDYLKKC